jgi:hypothetical protein
MGTRIDKSLFKHLSTTILDQVLQMESERWIHIITTWFD